MKNKSLYAQKIGKKLIPGLSQILSKRPDQFAPNSWPGYYSKAKGSKIWDLNSNKYLDMSISSIGSVILGYADEDVDRAVIKGIKKGNSSSLNSFEEIKLAKLLCKLHPWAKKVRYSKTGGEAMTIAVRIARAFTKKDKIAICGYHGWHDWYLAANLNSKNNLSGHWLSGVKPNGVPKVLKNTAFPFDYNDTKKLKSILNKNKNQIAAVILEPIRENYPQPGFLKEVLNLAKKHNAILIFDEISSGFRISNGGAHLKFNINPDIAVFSKAIGNGYPIGAIIGKSRVMSAAEESLISSTQWSEKSGVIASIATINKFIKNNTVNHLDKIGKLVQDGWLKYSKKHNIKIKISGIFPMSYLKFDYPQSNKIMTVYIQLMLDRNILASNRFYANNSHSIKDVEIYLRKLDEVFNIINKAIKNKELDKYLKGPIIKKGFHKFK
tara:strand:- start:6310 stop:7623 length:1314 start_codon:yes stop_codon:yes gene_type:complete